MRVCPYCHLLLGDAEAACPHDGTKTESAGEVPPVPAALHDKFGAFEPFARGQTGSCYLAKQNQTGYRGLLKVIPLGSMDASERVRLKRELRKQTQLVHDGLPRIIDGGEVGEDLWMFREHVAGESLAQRIRRLGKLNVSEALIVTAQVASALDELQRNGLLHRDVKAGHVIVHDDASSLPVGKLIDAGLPGRMPTGSVFDLLGTPAYISPEQIAGKLVSFRSDLYGLGCLLFEMLTGAPPFTGADVRAVLEAHKNTPAPMPELELPAPVQSLLRALLSKEPRQRPFSAQQVRRTLEPFLPPGASLPVLGARPMAAARAAADAQAAAAAGIPITEEIELEQIEAAVALSLSSKTLSLSAAEVEALEVREAPAPARTVQLSTAEMNALEVGDGRATAAPEARAAARASVQRAVELAPEPEPGAPVIAHAQATVASTSKAADSAPAADSAGASRPAVNFDVETLFGDEAAAAGASGSRSSLHDAAPTQLYRRSDEPGGPASDPAESGAKAGERDSQGTVIAAIPGMRKPLSVVWVGAGAAAIVLLIALVLRQGGKTSSESEISAAKSSAAKPASAAKDVEPRVVEAARVAAAPGATAVGGTPTSAGQPEQNAPANPSGTATGGADSHAAVAADQQAAADPGAQLVAAQTPPTGEPAAPTPPPGTVLPAAVAAGTNADAQGARGAELTAANEAARTQAGSARLAQQRGSRTDRVAKAEEYKAQGRSAYQAKRYRDAISAYTRATEQNPADAAAFAGLAASHLADGDTSSAIQSYSRAVRLQPNSSGFHAALGRAYLQRGDRARARAAYQHALQLDPKNGAAKTALAELN